jgi:Lysylphosphatidylglycerol synthase TM region
VAGVGALAWMVFHLGPGTLWAGMMAVGWGLALAWGGHLCGLLCDSVALRACAGEPGRKVRFVEYARIVVAGHGVNEASPFGKVGEVVKYTLLDERLEAADSAGALVAQNIAAFVVNCGLIALAAPIAFFFLDADSIITIAFAVVGVVFLAMGAGALVVLRRGVGGWPFRLLRRLKIGRFRISKARIRRWDRAWSKVEKSWKEATAVRGAMPTIWLASIASRLGNITETALLLHFLGGEHVVAGAFLNLAGNVFTGWAVGFVPMQAGSAEGVAYVVFRAVGLSPEVAVLVEICRKLRRIVFVAIGITVLGWDTFRRFMSGEGREQPADTADSEA